jgi:xyloglucan 6-xylosyltransferase
MGPKGPIRIEAGKLLTKTLAERPDFEADDQSALIYLLITQSELWSNKVFLESSFYLHGYWMIIVDKYEEIMEKYHPGFGDERWPFVTHFVGCKPCNSYHDHSIELCITQMERAFNFADNQILQLFGYQHLGLQTDKVKRTRNETADPLNLHLPMPKE